MKEPNHPHFVLSDAQYCHVLEDRLVIGKRELPEKLPEPRNKLDLVLLLLQTGGIAILVFFLVMTVIAKYYFVTFTVSALLLLLLFSIMRTIGFTNTKAIYKSDVLAVDYKKRSIGYDFFVVRYSGEHGKLWKRRLIIYDSQDCLNQALKVMKDAGLLK